MYVFGYKELVFVHVTCSPNINLKGNYLKDIALDKSDEIFDATIVFDLCLGCV